MKLINIILENELNLDENQALKSFMTKALKNISTNDIAGLRAVNPGLADDLLRIASSRSITGIKNADELVNILKSNKLSPQAMGDLMTGALKISGVSDDFIRVVTPKWVDDPRFIKAWTTDPTKKLTKNNLIKKGYSPQAADEIINYSKRSNKFQNALKNPGATGGKGGKGGKGGSTTTNPSNIKGGWEKFKELLNGIRSGWTWKKVLAWGAVIGLGGYALWDLLTNHGNGVVPTDMPDNPPSDWAPCVQNLLDSGKGTVNTNSQGLVSVKVIDERYPQGVLIYSNGRIADIATRRMGRWTCKQGQVQPTNESKKEILDRIKLLTNYNSSKTLNENINSLFEQDEAQLANDVETMIDLLDFPVTKGNLDSAYSLLKKYVDSGKSNEFLSLYQKSGFGGGDMKKSLDYVKAFNADTVQSKEKLENLLNQAMSGGGGSSSGSTGSLDDLEIIWDGDQGQTPTPTPGMSYFSCEDWDIRTKPHIIGCTSERIREVQSCLGLNPDGKFGPATEKALKNIESDVSKGITAEIYNKIMIACGRPPLDGTQGQVTTTEPAPDAEEVPTTQDTTGQQPVTGVTPIEYGETPYTAPQETGEQFYNRLLQAGLLVGSTDNRRIKYKGVALTKDDFDKLTQYLATFGFYPMKVKEKGDEKFKYVWKLSQNQ